MDEASKPSVDITGVRELISDAGLPEDVLTCLAVQIFSDCSSVVFSPFSQIGFSGALLMRVHGVRSGRSAIYPCIVKVAKPKQDIEREANNYRDHVRPHLPAKSVPTIYADRPAYEADWGAIAYSQIGARRESPQRLEELFYATTEPAKLRAILEKLFDDLMAPWIETRFRPECAWTWHEAYRITGAKLAEMRNSVFNLFSEHGRDLHDVFDPIRHCEAMATSTLAEPMFATSHGDLNGANVLFERGKDDPWLIDFAHTMEGHYLRDFTKLEAEIKFKMADKGNESKEERLDHWLEMDRALDVLPFGETSDLAPAVLGQADKEILKAYSAILDLRSLAFDRMLGTKERSIAEYRTALLLCTLHTLTFRDISPLKKEFAYRSAARLCQFKPHNISLKRFKDESTVPTFQMFIGETGDHGWQESAEIQQRYFCVVGLIMRTLDYSQEFVPTVEDLIRQYRIPFEFRFETRSSGLKQYNKSLQDLLLQSKFTLIGVVVDKYVYGFRDPSCHGNFYPVCLSNLLTLFCEYLNMQRRAGSSGIVVAPLVEPTKKREPTGHELSRLAAAYKSILSDGTTARSGAFFRRVLIGETPSERPRWPKDLAEKELRRDPSRKLRLLDHAGLQLAHLVAPEARWAVLTKYGPVDRDEEGGIKDLREILGEKYWTDPVTKKTTGFGKLLVK